LEDAEKEKWKMKFKKWLQNAVDTEERESVIIIKRPRFSKGRTAKEKVK